MAKLPRFAEGSELTPDDWNALMKVAERCNLSVAEGCGLILAKGPDGYTLGTSIPMPFYAKITGPISSGKYPFTQQFPASGGTWTNGPLTGQAYEENGNTSVATNTIVEMERTPVGDFRFQAGTC